MVEAGYGRLAKRDHPSWPDGQAQPCGVVTVGLLWTIASPVLVVSHRGGRTTKTSIVLANAELAVHR
jgi:hypothetical protein